MKAPLAILVLLAVCHPVFAETRTETVRVAMRDGVTLATDVYRDDALSPAPVVLMRTPYDRTRQKEMGTRWSSAGYIFVVQDCRGTRDSEGVLAPYNSEGQDGYDTIEWLTRQPWCNGRIGMVGGSYVGAVQWQAARSTGHLEQLLPESVSGRFRATRPDIRVDRGQHAQARQRETG